MIGRRIAVLYYCREKIRSDSSFLFLPIYIFTVIAVTTVTAVIVLSVKAGARFVTHSSGFSDNNDINDNTFDSGSHIHIDVTVVINIISRSAASLPRLNHICYRANKKLTEQRSQLRSLQSLVSLLAFLRRI